MAIDTSPGFESRKALLLAAQRELNRLHLDQDLRAAAYPKLVEWIADEARSSGEIDFPVRTSQISQKGTRPRSSNEASPIALIASALSVDLDVVEEVFADRDGRLEVTVPRGRLDRAKTAATRELAILAVLGRQVGEEEERTPVTVIRALCDEYGVLDGPNFAATIRSMDDVLHVSGRGQDREARLRRPGLEAAKRLILKFAGPNAE